MTDEGVVAGGSAPQGEDVEEASQKPGRSSVFFLLEAIINHSKYFPFTHLDTPPPMRSVPRGSRDIAATPPGRPLFSEAALAEPPTLGRLVH